jgi:ABC-type branched-subunit amino acid transport system ATPase component
MKLIVSGLVKRFAGLLAVDQLSFTAEPGKIVSLIGPNGAGKTTALSLISGLLQPDQGTVRVGEQDVTRLPAHALAALGIARTYQNLQIFQEMSVLEVAMVGAHRGGRGRWGAALLRLPAAVADEAALEATARAALARAGVPEDLFEREANTLSYGMQRRVEIARALAGAPKFLLLDEPAAGLNPKETEQIADLVLSLRESGLAILLVEHDMNMVMSISDQVVVINFGKLIATGTPDEVQRHPEVVRAYLGEGFAQEAVSDEAPHVA